MSKREVAELIAQDAAPASGRRAVTDATNITALPRKPLTSTQRSQQCRKRKAEAARAAAAAALAAAMPATAPAMPEQVPAAPDNIAATPRLSAGGRAATIATLIAALGLAGCSAFISVSGLAIMFAAAVRPAVATGIAFEIGKLAAISFLARSRYAPISFKIAVAALVAALMILNSVEIFGFFSASHIARIAADEIEISHHAARVESEIVVLAETVADFDRRIFQIDAIIGAATAKGRTQAALSIIESQSRTRADLVALRQTASQKLAGLKVQRDSVAGESRKLEADLGPIKFLAALLGTDPEKTMRGLILALALLLDPAAALLLFVACHRGRVL